MSHHEIGGRGDESSATSSEAPTRRGVLGLAAASILAGGAVATSSGQAAVAAAAPGRKIIVIGGGFCGVAAARDLRQRGYHVTLLEARNRLGGRTFTSEFAGRQVDFGGTWIHWSQPHVWSEVHRYGIGLAETPGAVANKMIYLDRAGKRHESTVAEQWPRIEKATSDLFEGGYSVMPRPAQPFADDKWVKADRFSLREKLDGTTMPDDVKPIVEALIMAWGNAPAAEISWVDMIRWYALVGYNLTVVNDAVSRFRIEGGTKTLLDAMAADAAADVRLSTPVSRVRQLKNSVEVLTEGGETFIADAVVCATPLNTLADIAFQPPLNPTQVKESKRRHAGQGVKVHILLDGEYENFSGWGPGEDAAINFLLWEGAENGKTHLIAFGPSSDALDVNDVAAVQAAVRKFLPQAKVSEAFGYEWTVDPYSKGTWFVSRPGQSSSSLAQLQAPSGNVFFANADWANGWRGFIDGAVEQGVITARQVDAFLSNKK